MEVTNRFKGLDLIDRVPKELWTEVRDIVQEIGIKIIPKKKKCKKAKWLSEEALQIAVTRREVKIKEGKETYTHLNAEFQRIARRGKKAIFFVWFGSDLGCVCVCVCVCACVRACVRGRGGALLSLIGMFTNLSNANIKVSSWLLKGNV